MSFRTFVQECPYSLDMSDFWDLGSNRDAQSERSNPVNDDDWDNKSEASGVSNLTNTFSQLGTEVIDFISLSFEIKFISDSLVIYLIQLK